MNKQPDNTSSITPDDHPFFFVADLLALDLVNTEIMVRGKPRDLLATPADLARWWQAAQRHYPERPEVRGAQAVFLNDSDVLVELRNVRAALRTIFSALVDGVVPEAQAIAQMNAVLRQGHHAIEATPAGDIQPVYQISDQTSSAFFFPIVLSAISWLTTGERYRLHRCANKRCVLLFYDTTKSATRRWCSTGCMDRARSVQRYQKVKQQAP
jgi:predicted RNA-binding Zn ribbon-like protein